MTDARLIISEPKADLWLWLVTILELESRLPGFTVGAKERLALPTTAMLIGKLSGDAGRETLSEALLIISLVAAALAQDRAKRRKWKFW